MVSYIHDSWQHFKATGPKAAKTASDQSTMFSNTPNASRNSANSAVVPLWKRILILIRDMSRPGWPMLFFIAFYLVTFSILEHANWPAYDYTVIHLKVDDLIPFCEVFIIPYLLWFPYMIVNETYFYLFDEDTYKRTSKMLYIGMSLFLLVSLLFPNIQHLRPTVMPRDNIFTRMVAALYRTDTPTNICPSIHVYNSLVIMIGTSRCRHFFVRKHKGLRAGVYTLGCLIIASTMLIKQHSVFDVICAFALAGVSYAICFRTSPQTSSEASEAHSGR